MFCERTLINIEHVACQWRGTAFSLVDVRYRPEQPRVRAHCRWRVAPSAPSCFFFACHHWALAILGLGHWNLPFHWHATKKGSRGSIRHHLERPNIVLSRNSDLVVCAQTTPRAKKKTFVYVAPTSSRGLYYRAASSCVSWLYLCMFRPFLHFFFGGARAFFLFLGVIVGNCWWGPARRVNPWRRHPDCSVQTCTQR